MLFFLSKRLFNFLPPLRKGSILHPTIFFPWGKSQAISQSFCKLHRNTEKQTFTHISISHSTKKKQETVKPKVSSLNFMTKHKSLCLFLSRFGCKDADENRWENYRARIALGGFYGSNDYSI